MERKKPAPAGQWIGSLVMLGGIVGAILSGQMLKNGSLAVGLFCMALAGLGIYLVSAVAGAAAEHRERNPRPAPPVVEDYPDDQTPHVVGYPTHGDIDAPRRRGFLSTLGERDRERGA
ncbi:hypothetical protein [Mycobacteroides abscessus]|uniref:hypothetical protein n=1 Tax=Mycobacteroides abscessus TaxID=36809 RepID=UPI000E682BF3|nr:hypothetical protein [Mycobacteroides abscessus]RIS81281.1 hypothetical protein D2E44_14580 [Mycobacteroides abscessus]